MTAKDGSDRLPIIPVNDLRRNWLATSMEAVETCTRVLRSGWYIQGPEHDAFEEELAEFVGVKHAAAVASGTDALRLAMQATGCGRGSVVLTAANAGAYAAIAAAELGAKCVYADVHPANLLMTPETVADALEGDVDVVVVTHLYGNAADMDGILRVCRSAGVSVIEDCAQAVGARVGGRRVGSWGDAATFSFYPTKNLGAAGDGGAVTTNSEVIAAAVKRIRQYGWSSKYQISTQGGINSRLDELQAALLRVGLKRVEESNASRIDIVDQYRAALRGSSLRVITGCDSPSVAHLAVLMVEEAAERDRVRAMLRESGVGTEVHYPLLDCDQAGLPHPHRRTDLPTSRDATGRVLSVPCFPEMTDSEIDFVANQLKRVARASDG